VQHGKNGGSSILMASVQRRPRGLLRPRRPARKRGKDRTGFS
jgi:hypothetical protein